MKKRVWLILGLFFLWGAGSTYWYVCRIKGFCQRPQNSVSITEEENSDILLQRAGPEKKELVYFEKSKVEPVINDKEQWTAEIKSLKDLQKEGKKLFIYGPYYEWEKNPSAYDNLGLARANALKKWVSSQIDTSLIITKSRLLTDENDVEYIPGFKGVFEWNTYNNYVKEEEPGEVLVYFPSNSDKEIKAKEIVVYLHELAGKLKEDPAMRIQLIGHTDNTGNSRSNYKLSKKRAERIKAVLISNGVPETQIEVIAKGENEPIADNNTKQGKQKNRRVEIKIIK
jgi:OOP family OmpA-OmpF porin